jgi:outer membrane receptor protein involved in Fe transport
MKLLNKTLKFNILILTILIWLPKASVLAQQSLSDTIEIEEVVVTGSKVEVARKNVPLSLSVITHDEIEQSGESAILPVISQQVPGVFVTERGMTGFGVANGAAGQINIRGLGGNPTTQVLILIDGHPQFMGLMGHPLPDAYVSSDIEKVEIIRGPASILYGSNAFGGVINIITRKQHSDGITLNAKALYGSYDTRKLSLNGGLRKNKFDVFASVNHDQTDGHRDTSDFAITNAYVKTGYKLSKNIYAVADFSLAHFEAADPGPENGIAGERIDIKRGKTALSVENNFNSLEGALKIYYNFGEHDITDGWHSNDDLFGIMFYQSLKLVPHITLTAGFDYMDYGGKGSPIISVIRDENGNIVPGPTGPQFVTSEFSDKWISMQNHALYMNYQHLILNKLSINAGIRYELNSTYKDELIPEAGAALNISNITTLKGSISKGYRPPSIRELYFFPPANNNLKPEQMMNYELSWIQKWSDLKIKTELTTYLCQGENLIIMVPSVAPPPPIYRNTGDFKNIGIEFSGVADIIKNLRIHTNYSFIHMDTPLPGTPEHNLFLSANYLLRKFNFNLSLQNISNLYNDIGGETSVLEKNYTVLGSQIRYQVTHYLNLFIIANNLLNEKYYIINGYPMPGINFLAGINLNLKRDFKPVD